MRFLVFTLFLVCHLTVCQATTPRSQAEITSLPGQNFQANFKQYAGYITVDQAHGRNLFYWFLESQGNPATDPVVLWLNGGPGCSTIGAGALEENGAYRPLLLNAITKQVGVQSEFFSWNKFANMIYLDSPAGVGYSYSNTLSDYSTNDNKTAIDTTTFLEIFFGQIYPDFASNPFWITGESYAGVYIPTLAYNILTNSSSPSLQTNLKKGGLMLGNPVTGCDGNKFQGTGNSLDQNDNVQNWYYHGMVSPRLFTEWNQYGCDSASPPNTIRCTRIYTEVEFGVGTFDQPLLKKTQTKSKSLARGLINPDCLYYSFCTGNATLEFVEDSVPSCFSVEDQIATYLNYPTVQSAFHARPTNWTACSNLNYTRNVRSVIPYLEQMFTIAPTMRILYYSGDIDIATVPFPSTFRCLETMNRPVKTPWRPWGFNNEIAGYVEIYDTYTLATLKAAGHEAPAYQPASAFNMFQSFLLNKPFPNA